MCPSIFASVSLQYKNPPRSVGLVQNKHHTNKKRKAKYITPSERFEILIENCRNMRHDV